MARIFVERTRCNLLLILNGWEEAVVNVSNRQQLLMILAGAAIVLLIGDRLVFEPLIHTWQDRSQRIVELKKSIAQGDVVVARASVIREQWDNMRTNTLPTDLS